MEPRTRRYRVPPEIQFIFRYVYIYVRYEQTQQRLLHGPI